MNKKEYKKNLKVLASYDINLSSEEIWENEPFSVELETYTNGGEDMIINLEEPSKECLQKYIDNFDINDEVMMWWRDGEDAARSKGVPFMNIKDHYEDYENFLDKLQEACDDLEY